MPTEQRVRKRERKIERDRESVEKSACGLIGICVAALKWFEKCEQLFSTS